MYMNVANRQQKVLLSIQANPVKFYRIASLDVLEQAAFEATKQEKYEKAAEMLELFIIESGNGYMN
jgi:hypothetical protein